MSTTPDQTGTASSRPRFETLGDIAAALEQMHADGMTVASIEYAIGQVYWAVVEERRAARAALEALARSSEADAGSQAFSDALASQGLPDTASVDDLIRHHRGNAGLAVALGLTVGSIPPAAIDLLAEKLHGAEKAETSFVHTLAHHRAIAERVIASLR